MRPIATACLFALLVSACVAGDPGVEAETPPLTDPPTVLSVDEIDPIDVRTTSGDQTGNRLVGGSGDLSAEPLVIDVPDVTWVVGAAGSDGSVAWVVTDARGEVRALAVRDGGVSELVPLGELAPGEPPTVLTDGDAVALLMGPESASPVSAPALAAGSVVSVSTDGVVTLQSEVRSTLEVTALGDSRIVVDERDRAAILSDPTAEYAHGVLGDRVESTTVTVFDPVSGVLLGTATAPEGTVFEALSPMWADVDGDDVSELVMTASDSRAGARLVVYEADGTVVASSTPIGTGNRWRNLLAVGPTAPDGSIEVSEVETPHIGGILQWHRLEGDELVEVTAEQPFSTHRLGSRNLDQGLVGDVDGDGRLDALVPTQRQEALVAWSRIGDSAEPVLEIDLGARLATNIAGVTTSDGSLSIALGLEDGRLLIWP